MPAYIIGSITVTDPAGYEEYRARVPAVIAAHGGRYVVRGGQMEVAGGRLAARPAPWCWSFRTCSASRPSMTAPDYAPLLAIRKRCAVSNLIAVEGYVP